MAETAQALWHEAPGRCGLRDEAVSARPGEAIVRALWSGVSRGTERLVHEGRVPRSEWERMRAPNQSGEFPFPVKYGYCMVGVVELGPEELVGRVVFALHPHQSRFALPVDALVPLPAGLPPRRATLAANMETALNAVWDGRTAPGDRIAVVGAGPVGLLVASILGRTPGVDVTACDVLAQRGEIAAILGINFSHPVEAPRDCDVVFHASATSAGLAAALDMAGPEATVVEMSWHGDRDVSVPLGGPFHSRRLSVVSTQVGSLPTWRRPRWTHRRRLETALALLADDDRLDALIDREIDFAASPAALPEVLRGDGLAAAIRYDRGGVGGGGPQP